jgi:hypothetical protein
MKTILGGIAVAIVLMVGMYGTFFFLSVLSMVMR